MVQLSNPSFRDLSPGPVPAPSFAMLSPLSLPTSQIAFWESESVSTFLAHEVALNCKTPMTTPTSLLHTVQYTPLQSSYFCYSTSSDYTILHFATISGKGNRILRGSSYRAVPLSRYCVCRYTKEYVWNHTHAVIPAEAPVQPT